MFKREPSHLNTVESNRGRLQPPPLASKLAHAHATPPTHTHRKNCVQRLEIVDCSTPRESNLLWVLIWGRVLVRLLPLSIMGYSPTNCTPYFSLATLISNCYMSPNTQRMRHFSDTISCLTIPCLCSQSECGLVHYKQRLCHSSFLKALISI